MVPHLEEFLSRLILVLSRCIDVVAGVTLARWKVYEKIKGATKPNATIKQLTGTRDLWA